MSTRARMALAKARDDRGSASIWLLGIALAVVTLAAVVTGAAGVLIAHHRAQAAADLGALAGAPYAVQGLPATCAVAGRVVEANDAQLVGCVLDGLDVTITVEARSFGHPGPAWVSATARAGPERAGQERAGAPATGGDG